MMAVVMMIMTDNENKHDDAICMQHVQKVERSDITRDSHPLNLVAQGGPTGRRPRRNQSGEEMKIEPTQSGRPRKLMSVSVT